MRLHVKSEVDACRDMSVMPGQTDRQTDRLFLMPENLIEQHCKWKQNETKK